LIWKYYMTINLNFYSLF